MPKVDYDRGVTKRIVPSSGVEVYMYKDQPGIYYSAFNKPVSEDLAKMAGFDIEKYGKAKLKADRMKAAMKAIEAELDVAPEARAVLYERAGFTIVSLGTGYHNVIDPDNNVLNTTPVPEEAALKLIEQLAPKGVTKRMDDEASTEDTVA